MKEVIGISLILVFSIYSLVFIVLLSKVMDTDFTLEIVEDEMYANRYIEEKVKQRQSLLTMFYADSALLVATVVVGVLVFINQIDNILPMLVFMIIISLIKIGLSIYNIKQSDINNSNKSLKEIMKQFKAGDDVKERLKLIKEMKE